MPVLNTQDQELQNSKADSGLSEMLKNFLRLSKSQFDCLQNYEFPTLCNRTERELVKVCKDGNG